MTLVINLKELSLYIDVYDNPLAKKWINYLTNSISRKLKLEKSYCFLGWPESNRNVEFICEQINKHINTINSYNWEEHGLAQYEITRKFTPESCVIPGELEAWTDAGHINHDTLNWLHRYFEELQGTQQNPSLYYAKADDKTKTAIKHLNLLCHEMETFQLSYRKMHLEPEWIRPSQLMCWEHAERFKLKDEDFNGFGLDAIGRELGGVYMGVNKDVGKTWYEIWRDEDGPPLNSLTSIAAHSTRYGTSDFDIEWGSTISGSKYIWHKQHLEEFKRWLVDNKLDPEDKELAIGHPKVGQIDLMRTFGNDKFEQVYNIMKDQTDVKSIEINGLECHYV